MSQEKAQLIAPIGIVTFAGVTATGIITGIGFTGNVVGSATSIKQGTNVSAGFVTATSFAGNLTGNILRLADPSGGDPAPDINVGATTATSFVGNLTGSVTDLTSAPNITVGVVTATALEGPVTGNVTGDASGYAGGLGVNYNGGWTGAGTSQINAGVVTATTFYGDGSNLDGVSSGPVTQQAVTIDSASTAIDLEDGNLIYATQSADTTISFTNVSNGIVYFIRIKDDTSIARTITWPAEVTWDGGTTPTLLNNPRGTDAQIFLLITRDEGTTWYGKEVVNIDPQTFGMYVTGANAYGQLGINNNGAGGTGQDRSSPTQIGTEITWNGAVAMSWYSAAATKTDGTLYAWGYNAEGSLGQNNTTNYSSPVQIPGTTWSTNLRQVSKMDDSTGAIKTDGTLWMWGNNGAYNEGKLMINDTNDRSSPTQVGTDTTWSKVSLGNRTSMALKTDGSLWVAGSNSYGLLGLNQIAYALPQDASNKKISSPTQIPGTWADIPQLGYIARYGIKTDGTLWSWGNNVNGALGLNSTTVLLYSSPCQIGTDTTWSKMSYGNPRNRQAAIKTDGTMWIWGSNSDGGLGQNQALAQLTATSSPVQIGGGTDWDVISMSYRSSYARKTDGSLWVWGESNNGRLGLNEAGNPINYSSPTQLPGTWGNISSGLQGFIGLKSQ